MRGRRLAAVLVIAAGLGLPSQGSAGSAWADELGAAKPVSGSLQFWRRSCTGAGVCELPTAVGERLPVNGELSPPVAPGTVGRFGVHLAEAGLSLDLLLLWVAPPDGSSSYLVAQARLLRQIGEDAVPTAECSQYHGQEMQPFFPVGACAGFVPRPEGGYDEWGVTFSRN